MDLSTAVTLSARGMDAQGTRLRVIAENLANQDSAATTPGGEPYQRKTVSFQNRLDRQVGAETVRVREIGRDRSEYPLRFEPGNPAADKSGYVKTPNVNSFVELMDMREAQRSYTANLSVMQATRAMLTRTIEMLK